MRLLRTIIKYPSEVVLKSDDEDTCVYIRYTRYGHLLLTFTPLLSLYFCLPHALSAILVVIHTSTLRDAIPAYHHGASSYSIQPHSTGSFGSDARELNHCYINRIIHILSLALLYRRLIT